MKPADQLAETISHAPKVYFCLVKALSVCETLLYFKDDILAKRIGSNGLSLDALFLKAEEALREESELRTDRPIMPINMRAPNKD